MRQKISDESSTVFQEWAIGRGALSAPPPPNVRRLIQKSLMSPPERVHNLTTQGILLQSLLS